jgi:hypothetical protein
MKNFMTEVERFKRWANKYPVKDRYGEWECDYRYWRSLYRASLEFIDCSPFENWSDKELSAVLYILARDNEMQYIARETRRQQPELLIPLAKAAMQIGERDDRWQLAVELGNLGTRGKEEEQLLLAMVQDEHE